MVRYCTIYGTLICLDAYRVGWGLRVSEFDGLDELLNRGAFHKSHGMGFRLKRIIASVAL